MPNQNFTAAQAAVQITRDLRNPDAGSNPPYSATSKGNWVETFGTPITLNYAFRTTAPTSYPVSNMNGFSAMNGSQQALVIDALQKWSDVANISFTPVAEAQANFLFANFSGDAGLVNAIDGYGGWSASWTQQSGQPRVYTRNSHVWIDSTATYATAPTLENGAYHLYQHEIGHAITLAHPGFYDAAQGTPTYAANAVYNQDTLQYTTMSYFAETNFGLANFGGLKPMTPMLHDIAAVQAVYGARTTTRTGDTVYGFNSNTGDPIYTFSSATTARVFCIWDSGGTDTINGSGYNLSCVINLNQGEFSSMGPRPNAPGSSMIYNISIAFGTVIENAVGGSSDDTITANTANNTINGSGGTSDTVVFAGARSAYTLTDLGGGSVQVDGPGGRDTLSNVERLQFDDQTVTWPPAGPVAGSVSINDVSVAEGNAGTTLLTFTVTRTGGTAAFSVNYATANGTASSGSDYVSASGPLSFGSGINSQSVVITINGDTTSEPDETLFVNLSGATNGAAISDSQGQGTIQNDDAAPVAGSVSINDVSITEGNAGNTLLTFTVTRTGGTAAFAVSYATAANTASGAAGDYVATSGTLSFGSNVNTQTISITINGDTTVEPTETFFVNLSAATNGATISDGQGIGTIVNDDGSPDDFADSLNDATSPFGNVAINGLSTGQLEVLGDRDWFRVQLTKGATYLFDLQGQHSGGGTLFDPYLYLHDSSGALLAEQDDIDPGVNRDSTLAFTAKVSGTYYLEAGAFEEESAGTYRVFVSFLPQALTNDFNRDGHSDFLWRNDSGAVAIWELNGGQIVDGHDLPAFPTSWKIVGNGDFNADAQSDILWHHDNGALRSWQINAGQVVADNNLGGLPSTWQVAGIGDFNGDGINEVLWRHENGAVQSWEVDGDQVTTVHNLAGLPSTWQIEAVGDLNGNGRSEMLWRHVNGAVQSWELSDASQVSTVSVLNGLPSTWSVEGLADFNGDGRDDILWRHFNGALQSWEVNGSQITAVHNLPSLPSTWQVEGFGDFNSDDRSDIAWRHNNGGVATWEMNGGTILAGRDFPALPTSWHLEI